MTPIPEDIMRAAEKLAWDNCGCAPSRRRSNGTNHSDGCHEHKNAIARALMAAHTAGQQAERERCAKIVEQARPCTSRMLYPSCYSIASAIRKGESK